MALEVENRLVGEASVKLHDQPRLADPRLASDRHDLPLAAHGGGQPASQEIQLVTPAHEPRATAPGGLAPLEAAKAERGAGARDRHRSG